LNNHSYFYERAEAEFERAQRASHPEAVKTHYLLAGYYLDRVYGDEKAVMFGGSAGEGRCDAG
jgi:hypothetical protein